MDPYKLGSLISFARCLTEFLNKATTPLFSDYDMLERLKSMALELAENHLLISKEILRTDTLKREVELLHQQLHVKETLIEYLLAFEAKGGGHFSEDQLSDYAQTFIN